MGLVFSIPTFSLLKYLWQINVWGKKNPSCSNSALVEVFYTEFKCWFRNCFRDLFQLLFFLYAELLMPLYAHNLQYHRLQKQRPLTLIWHVEKASNPLKVLNFCGDFFPIHLSSKVIHPKYFEHWQSQYCHSQSE